MNTKPNEELDDILAWFIGYPKADSLDPESWEEAISKINDVYVRVFENMVESLKDWRV